MRIVSSLVLFAATAMAQVRIPTSSVPVATQYQSYSTILTATGGTPPYRWSVDSSTGVSLPEGMSLNAATGVVSATQVNGQGGYAVTVQVTDSSSPSPGIATATLNFGVNSDTSLGGCQMFPPDSIFNQRADLLPVDTNPSHQIPSGYLKSPLHPDFGQGFYPAPGGIPWMRVPAIQPATNVNLANSGQIDGAGTYAWPFPAWPNAVVEGTSYGQADDDHHILILETNTGGPCTLYETYQSTDVPSMFNAGNNTWGLSAGIHYVLNSNEIAASTSTLDNGAQDSPGIPMVPLLLRHSEVPLGAQHPLRITFPSPTNGWVWPGTGCCGGSGPPQGLLYRLRASVNWQATCPASSNPQAATVLQALQQYGAYMSDHGSQGYVQGVPDVRWNDDDLACIKKFHVSDLEVVDNSALEVSSISGQTQPYVAPAALPGGTAGQNYSATFSAVGGNPATRQWTVSSGALPPGLVLDQTAGTISGTLASSAGGPYSFGIVAKDTTSGYSSRAQAFSIVVAGSVGNPPAVITSLTNSASGAGGAIAPGELVTLKGAMLGPATGISFSTNPVAQILAGTQVSFGGWAAPILYASATQINAIVPWEVAGQSQVTVQVQYAGAAGSANWNSPVASAAPGVFTFNATGAGQAVALNLVDYSPNGPDNPAAAGSYVVVYGTGGGVTDPPGVTGSVSTQAQYLAGVTATVGNVPATVTYAGSAPGLVDGVNQLNILLSPDTPRGSALPLVITTGGRASAATATLSVR